MISCFGTLILEPRHCDNRPLWSVQASFYGTIKARCPDYNSLNRLSDCTVREVQEFYPQTITKIKCLKNEALFTICAVCVHACAYMWMQLVRQEGRCFACTCKHLIGLSFPCCFKRIRPFESKRKDSTFFKSRWVSAGEEKNMVWGMWDWTDSHFTLH